MASFEVFCGVFAVLSYRAIFHSDRALSLGSILMLVALSAAVTQLFTSHFVYSVSEKLFSGSMVEGDGVESAQPHTGHTAPRTGQTSEQGYFSSASKSSERGSETHADSTQQTDLKSEILRQMSGACDAADLGVWGSMVCRQLF